MYNNYASLTLYLSNYILIKEPFSFLIAQGRALQFT